MSMETLDRVAFTDQRDRIEEMQQALYHAAQLMEAFSVDRLDKREAMPAAFFASLALEYIAEGQAEDAIQFANHALEQIVDKANIEEANA